MSVVEFSCALLTGAFVMSPLALTYTWKIIYHLIPIFLLINLNIFMFVTSHWHEYLLFSFKFRITGEVSYCIIDVFCFLLWALSVIDEPVSYPLNTCVAKPEYWNVKYIYTFAILQLLFSIFLLQLPYEVSSVNKIFFYTVNNIWII